MAFDLPEVIERVWERIGLEQSEAEKGLYRDELEKMVDACLKDLAVEIAEDPVEYTLLQTRFQIPISGGLGAVTLIGGTGDGRTPDTYQMLIKYIRVVEYKATGLAEILCHPLKDEHELYRPQPLGRIWWVVRSFELATIDDLGNGRYSSTLSGHLILHANYIPTIGLFPLVESIQSRLVDHLERRARAKGDPRFALALLKEMRA